MKLVTKEKGRLVCFDCENRPLAYWYDGETTSEITAFGWKWSDENEVHTMLLRRDGRFDVSWGSTRSDSHAYMTFHGVLCDAKIVYGHNIRKHDLKMTNAALMRRKLPTLPSLLTSDTLRDIPGRAGLSASLENLAAMYELEGEKYTMTQPAWEKANRLSPDGMELARKRVVADVLLQEKLRAKLLDLGILEPPKRWSP